MLVDIIYFNGSMDENIKKKPHAQDIDIMVLTTTCLRTIYNRTFYGFLRFKI